MNNKNFFKDFCEKNKNIPLFLSYDWASIVSEEQNWDVALDIRGGKIFAFLIYFIRKKYGHTLIENPPLTPYSGIYYLYPNGQKNARKLKFEKESGIRLINQLPEFSHFYLPLHPQINNWLPFYWNDFKETTRYTFIIKNMQDPDQIFSEFSDNIRWDIRKAQKNLYIETTNDPAPLYNFKKKNYQYQGHPLPVTWPYLKNLAESVQQKNLGKLLKARNNKGDIHAQILLVWDRNCIYYLFAATNPYYKKSGAMSLLLYEAIKMALEENKIFNFEGSMTETVNRFFTGFGGELVPYHVISKTPSKLLSFYKNYITG